MNEWSFFVQMVGTNLGKCESVWGGNTMMAESKLAKFKMAEFKMAAIIKLSEIEWVWVRLKLVWVRVRVEWECFWVNQREDNKVSDSKMAVAEINHWQYSKWLPSSSWVRMNEWSFFVQIVGTNLGKCEWVWEEILWWLNPSWPNLRWQNSRWLPSSS